MLALANSRSTLILILGDIVAYILALVLTLTVRYGAVPSRVFLAEHLTAFSILTVIFVLANMSAGLYDKRAAYMRDRSNATLFIVQAINIMIGFAFFYLAPVSIAPKANLIIYFVITTILLYLWRTAVFPVLSHTRRQKAIMIGAGSDIEDLEKEMNDRPRYGLYFADHVTPQGSAVEMAAQVEDVLKRSGARIIVADLYNPSVEALIPHLYNLVFSGIQIVDAERLYESIFDRVPLSIVGERWLIEHSNTVLGNRIVYDALKRTIDIVISVVLGVISLIIYPLVYLAIKIEDRGPIFISQERVGGTGKLIRLYKFRTMSGNDNGKYSAEGKTELKVTRVGAWLRNSRIDELPQLWNVFRGDLSLIGPRPEFPALTAIYEKEVSYYNARHLVKPGLSGWAQIYHQTHPHHEVDAFEARNKLSYDLYYIKNRSLAVDSKIVLRTIQILMQRVGR